MVWVRFPNRTIGVNLAIFDNIPLHIRVEVSAPTGLGFVKQRFSTQILKKYAETPKQKPQANKPYGIQEVFEVFTVSASYPVRLGNRTIGVNLGIFHDIFDRSL